MTDWDNYEYEIGQRVQTVRCNGKGGTPDHIITAKKPMAENCYCTHCLYIHKGYSYTLTPAVNGCSKAGSHHLRPHPDGVLIEDNETSREEEIA